MKKGSLATVGVTRSILALAVALAAGSVLATDYYSDVEATGPTGSNSASNHSQVLLDSGRLLISSCSGETGCCCTDDCSGASCSEECEGSCSAVGTGQYQACCDEPDEHCGACCFHGGAPQDDFKVHQTCCSSAGSCCQGDSEDELGPKCDRPYIQSCLTLGTDCSSPVATICQNGSPPLPSCPAAGERLSVALSIPGDVSYDNLAALHAGNLKIHFNFDGAGPSLTTPLAPLVIKEPPTPLSYSVPTLSDWWLTILAGMLVIGAVSLILQRYRSRSS